jgi:hypothetical protein
MGRVDRNSSAAGPKNQSLPKSLACPRIPSAFHSAPAREVLGRTLPFIVPYEGAAVPLIRKHVASGTTVHADESRAWDILHASYPMMRVNHSREFKSEDGACTNAESWFSWLRRAEMGIHHRISSKYLYQYANEMAWREDHRREPNGLHFRRVTGAALRHPKSEVWRVYWQRSAA